MQYDLIPVNAKILLKRAVLEVDEKEAEVPEFHFQESAKIDIEYFQIVEMAKDCSYNKVHKGDFVTVETYTSIGFFEGIEMFVCDERFVTCRLCPINAVTSNK